MSLHRLDLQRAYLHFFLACCEDGPFIILHMLLVRIQLRDTLKLSSACQGWLTDKGDPTILLLVFMASVASLAYKSTHLMLLPEIWQTGKLLAKDQERLHEREHAMFEQMAEERRSVQIVMSGESLNGQAGQRFVFGARVSHTVHGRGTVIEVNTHDRRGKPYIVQFDNGETHQYSEESAVKLQLCDERDGNAAPQSRGSGEPQDSGAQAGGPQGVSPQSHGLQDTGSQGNGSQGSRVDEPQPGRSTGITGSPTSAEGASKITEEPSCIKDVDNGCAPTEGVDAGPIEDKTRPRGTRVLRD